MTGPIAPEPDTSTSTLMLAAFEGWNDAGGCATQAVAMLADEWGAEVVHRVDPEQYHDFQVTRPLTTCNADGGRLLEWPQTTVSLAVSPANGRRFAAFGTHDDFVLVGLFLRVVSACLRAFEFALADFAVVFPFADVV